MAKLTNIIDLCPNCGSRSVNKVDKNYSYCKDCCVEIDNNGKVYTVQWDGELVDFYMNDFADIN